MVARKVQNSKFGRCRGRILNLSIKEVMVASKTQHSNFGRGRGRISKFEFRYRRSNDSKKLGFRRLAIPRKCRCQLNKSKICFGGLDIAITASAKCKNAKYKKMTVQSINELCQNYSYRSWMKQL